MQKTDPTMANKSVRRHTMPSTTLNRRYVKRPVKNTDVKVSVKQNSQATQNTQISRSAQISHFNHSVSTTSTKRAQPAKSEVSKAVSHPVHEAAKERMKAKKAITMQKTSGRVSAMTAKELKDQAIRKALESAAKTDSAPVEVSSTEKVKKSFMGQFRVGRVMLVLTCTAAAVFAIVSFVNLNMPDISLRVAAMQTGIEASYPNYVPRDFTLSDIASEENKVTLTFNNGATGESFSLVEEKSSWDSNALQNNYVKNEYPETYSTIREQGLTIFVDGSNATWVNGGVLYKLTAANDTLTKKQIKTIATSL